ncbi:hypothetical protein F5Y05DRAFT_209337 [Hypoxylon sp. FL0543]|nr:hypothetical protein F5Y05DRAFT_209337 [Hypoxylon sp. FL0543]
MGRTRMVYLKYLGVSCCLLSFYLELIDDISYSLNAHYCQLFLDTSRLQLFILLEIRQAVSTRVSCQSLSSLFKQLMARKSMRSLLYTRLFSIVAVFIPHLIHPRRSGSRVTSNMPSTSKVYQQLYFEHLVA